MKYSILFTAMSLILTGCGGSGGSASNGSTADVSGIVMPDSMSVVTAESSGSNKLTFGKSTSKFSSQFISQNKSITDTDS